MTFNVNKCKVMYVARNNFRFKYYMNGLEIDSKKEEKDLTE